MHGENFVSLNENESINGNNHLAIDNDMVTMIHEAMGVPIISSSSSDHHPP